MRLAALLIASGFLVGCGGGDKPALCSDLDALNASVDDLKSVNATEARLAELEDDLTQVRSSLGKVKSDAEQQYSDEIMGVDQAYATLASDLSSAVSSPSTGAIAQVGSDVRSLGMSLTALNEAVRNTC